MLIIFSGKVNKAVKPTNANAVLQFELKIFFQSSSAVIWELKENVMDKTPL